ncbi:aminotransferase class I/II-fold pyridoxal phosphate-dependent enzyme, partial [Nostoc sp. NIES-2111]
MTMRDAFLRHCRSALDSTGNEGRYREFTQLEKLAARFPIFRWHGAQGSRELTVWSSNDYLGMGSHPAVLQAATAVFDRHGVGAGGTRNISGTSPLHAMLEGELANLHDAEAALLFGSGYIANEAAQTAVLEALPDAIVFSDEKNPASMIAGTRGTEAP